MHSFHNKNTAHAQKASGGRRREKLYIFQEICFFTFMHIKKLTRRRGHEEDNGMTAIY